MIIYITLIIIQLYLRRRHHTEQALLPAPEAAPALCVLRKDVSV